VRAWAAVVVHYARAEPHDLQRGGRGRAARAEPAQGVHPVLAGRAQRCAAASGGCPSAVVSAPRVGPLEVCVGSRARACTLCFLLGHTGALDASVRQLRALGGMHGHCVFLSDTLTRLMPLCLNSGRSARVQRLKGTSVLDTMCIYNFTFSCASHVCSYFQDQHASLAL